MAEPTQLAFRTQKSIGILNTAPVYEPLPAFVRCVHLHSFYIRELYADSMQARRESPMLLLFARRQTLCLGVT